MIIYLIQCLVNGKGYIGQTTRPIEERWKEHCYNSNKFLIGKAIRKHGPQKFKIYILAVANNLSELNRLEIKNIKKQNTKSPNAQKGKKRGPHSSKHKTKISIANTGKKQSPETLARLSAIRKGKTPWNKGLITGKGQKCGTSLIFFITVSRIVL